MSLSGPGAHITALAGCCGSQKLGSEPRARSSGAASAETSMLFTSKRAASSVRPAATKVRSRSDAADTLVSEPEQLVFWPGCVDKLTSRNRGNAVDPLASTIACNRCRHWKLTPSRGAESLNWSK